MRDPSRTSGSARRRRLPGWTEALGYVAVGAGYVLMGLGIFEIGGLFAVCVGFLAVLAGCVMLFARASQAGTTEEEVFAAQLRDL